MDCDIKSCPYYDDKYGCLSITGCQLEKDHLDIINKCWKRICEGD